MGLLDGGIGDIIKTMGGLVENYLPSDTEKTKLALQAQELALKGKELDLKVDQMDTDLASKQIDVNIEEAKNPNLFVAGWRPALGWAGVIALLYKYVAFQFLNWLWCLLVAEEWILKTASLPPDVDVTALIGFLTILVGARQVDKWRGTDTSTFQTKTK